MDTTPPAAAPSGGTHKSFLRQIEDFFDTYLHKKAPFHLPPSAKEAIVKVGPWIAVILIVLTLPVIFAAIGLGAVVTPFAMIYGGLNFGISMMLRIALSIITLVMQIIALPGLFHRSLKAWYLVYYASLISAVGGLISYNIIGTIISLVISMYILFEIREYYK